MRRIPQGTSSPLVGEIKRGNNLFREDDHDVETIPFEQIGLAALDPFGGRQ